MSSIREYVGTLFNVFFRWWWAAITGVFTIIGVFLAPEQGITLSRIGLGLIIFFGLTLAFLSISVVATSWRWYLAGGVFPTVVGFVPEKKGETALTVIVQSDPHILSSGTYLALFRVTQYGIESCAAVLEVKSKRNDGKGYQAEPVWISAVHKTALQKGEARLDDLRLRVVSRDVLSLVAKCVLEQS